MSRIEVQIMGQGYVLASPEGAEDALKSAAARVNTAMCDIRDAGKIKARDRIAVLASLNIAFDLEQAQAAPALAATPAPTATQTDGAAGAHDEQANHLLRDLIGRVDQALQRDGQLL